MRVNLAQAQQRWAERSMHEDVEEEAESVWAWMSGIEMVSLLTFVGLQIFLFERFSLPSSVI
jgi:flagellar biogenesis protein FliO